MRKSKNQNKFSNPLETTNFRFQKRKKNLFFTHKPLKNKFLTIKRFELENKNSKTNKETNNGYWTKSEHNKFIEALYLYNCDWMKIKSHLKNRAYYQISSHAQKFFLKLKTFKDEKLGLDFTSDNINKLKDIITIIKQKEKNESLLDNNINKKLLFIISEKLSFGKAPRQKEEEKTLETKEENKMNNIENNNVNDINDINNINDIEDINIINDVNYINSIDKINYENISDKLSINNDFLAINSMKYYDISSSINDSEKDYESIFTNVENNSINDLIFLKRMIYLRDIID